MAFISFWLWFLESSLWFYQHLFCYWSCFPCEGKLKRQFLLTQWRHSKSWDSPPPTKQIWDFFSLEIAGASGQVCISSECLGTPMGKVPPIPLLSTKWWKSSNINTGGELYLSSQDQLVAHLFSEFQKSGVIWVQRGNLWERGRGGAVRK